MVRELITFIGDTEVGRFELDRTGKLSFAYAESWRSSRGAYPISLSMPLARAKHDGRVVQPFMWGLLPDNTLILERWGKRFQASPRNPFALLSHVGEDCPGALRLIRPERLDTLDEKSQGKIDWLDEADIADRLRELRDDVSAWRTAGDEGQFSLAGAQPKTAFHYDGSRWGVPSGRIPTTHILKPGVPGFDDHAHNEHFCLLLAYELGFPVASSRVMRFENEVAIVVKRYDRQNNNGVMQRVHQEDMCQALAVHPEKKYENEGGPGARKITELLRLHSGSATEDVATFVDALALSWLIGGSDAHAKNYSVLIGANARVRLAPLYDIASILPYAKLDLRKQKLAMKVGGKYRIVDIGRHEWTKLAISLELDCDEMICRHIKLAEQVPDLASDVLREARRDGLSEPTLDHLAAIIGNRAIECVKWLHAGTARATSTHTKLASLKAKLAGSNISRNRELRRPQLEALRDGFEEAAKLLGNQLDEYQVVVAIPEKLRLPDASTMGLHCKHTTIAAYCGNFRFKIEIESTMLVVNAQCNSHPSRPLITLSRGVTPPSEQIAEEVVGFVAEELSRLVDAADNSVER